jgi:hypothetical protein
VGIVGENLKTIIPVHATIANQPIDATMEQADGHTTGTANDITPGTGYVTPDTRNKFLLGADRTLASGNGSSSDAAGVAGGAAPAGSPGPRGSAGSMSHTIASGDMPSHSHQINISASATHGHGTTVGTSTDGSHQHGGVNFTRASNFTSVSLFTSANQLGTASYPSTSGGTDAQTQPAHSGSTSTAGAHTHTATLSNAGSGTACDIRPGHVGIVHVIKIKRVGLVSVQLARAVPYYATAANEALPAGYSLADGSTLAAGTHDVPASQCDVNGNYVLADMRNKFALGADATKAPGTAAALGDTSASAPGPLGTGGNHQLTVAVGNLPAHGHSGTLASDGSHTHNWSITAHSSHSHTTDSSGFAMNVSNGVEPYRGGSSTTIPTTAGVAGAGTHAHTFSPVSDLNHGHTVSASSTGGLGDTLSGGAYDQRPRYCGVVWIVRTKATGLVGLPLKAIVALDATAANEAIPADLEYCDGRTLSPGTHDIGGGGSSFVLPDLRNRRKLGADPTQTFQSAGSISAGPGPGALGGAHTAQLTNANTPAHTHGASTDTAAAHNHTSSSLVAIWDLAGNSGENLTYTNAIFTTGATVASDSHAHTVTIVSASGHDHGTTMDSTATGSGGTWDIRTVFLGTVLCMKVRN